MCYDIKATQEAQIKRARTKGRRAAVDEIMETLIVQTDLPLFHATRFSHPNLLIYTDRSTDFPEVATWCLVPNWVRDEDQMKKSWNNTLNGRSETIFEKNSLLSAAKYSRCIIYIDGFYEHRHYKKDIYTFYIHKKNNEPMVFAGPYSDWQNPKTGGRMNTFSITNTTSNPLMAKIYNNPTLEGPRMPLILPEELADKWLMQYNDELDEKCLEELIQEYPEDELEAYTVQKLRGKNGVGYVEEASKPCEYDELLNL